MKKAHHLVPSADVQTFVSERPLFTWVDTSPNDFRNRPHRSFELNLPNLRIQVFTDFVDRSLWRVAFYPNIVGDSTLPKAPSLERAQAQALDLAIESTLRLKGQLESIRKLHVHGGYVDSVKEFIFQHH